MMNFCFLVNYILPVGNHLLTSGGKGNMNENEIRVSPTSSFNKIMTSSVQNQRPKEKILDEIKHIWNLKEIHEC